MACSLITRLIWREVDDWVLCFGYRHFVRQVVTPGGRVARIVNMAIALAGKTLAGSSPGGGSLIRNTAEAV